MISAALEFLTLLASPAGSANLPASVASVTIEDLIRFSDAIVVGKVERVANVHRPAEEVPPRKEFGRDLGQDVPFAELTVSRILKGAPELNTVLYLARSTWTCDITTAEVGESVLLFLAEEDRNEFLDPKFQARLRTSLPRGERMQVLWSGRGRMPLRTIEGTEYATYWDGDVILPKDAPSVEGADPAYSFKRSLPLSWMEEKVRSCLEAQKAPWFRASVSDVRDGNLPWDLDVALDGRARLVVHGVEKDREVRYIVSSARRSWITSLIRSAALDSTPQSIGSGDSPAGVRRLQVVPPEPELDFRIFALDETWIRSARGTLEMWDQVRGSFDEPGCADHRRIDAEWLELVK